MLCISYITETSNMDPHRNLWSPPIVEPTVVRPDNPVASQPFVPPPAETPPQPVVSATYAYDQVPQPPVETPAYTPAAPVQSTTPTEVDQRIAAENYAMQANDYALPGEQPPKLQRLREFSRRHRESLVVGGVSFLVLVSVMSYAVAHFKQASTPSATLASTATQVTGDDKDESAGGTEEADSDQDTTADEENTDADAEDSTEDEDIEESIDADADASWNEDIVEDEGDGEDAIIDDSKDDPVVTPTPTPIPAKPVTTQTHKFTVGSWNTNSDNKNNVGTEVLDMMTKTQILGLQELHDKPQRDNVKNKVICSSCKYAGYIPAYSSGGAAAASYPIIWEKSAFTIVGSGNSQQMCDAAKSSKYSYAARYATYVRLQSKVNGKQFYVISTHFMAGEGSKGKPTSDSLLTSRYKTHMSKLTALINSLKSANIPIYVTGTFNVDYRYDRTVKTSYFPYASLGAISVRSNWDYLSLGGISSSKGSVSSSNRLVDYVFALQRSDMTANAISLSSSGHGSSHYAVFFTSTIK